MNVIIIGGGVIGLSIAYKLIKLDINVTIFDKDRLGRGASWVAGGMIAPQAEGLEEGDFLNLCLESRDMFPQFIQEIESDTGLETGYWQCGILKLAFSEEEKEKIKKDIERFQELGLRAQWLEREDIEKEVKIGEEVLGGALYPDDAQVDNRKLVIALEEFVKRHAKVYEFEPVEEILTENGKFKAVKTKNYTLGGDVCIISAGAWSGKFNIPVFPVKGEMAAVDVEKQDINRVFYSSRAYLIPRKNYNRLVIGATQENIGFKDGNTVKGTLFLLKGLTDTIPHLKENNIQELWYGYRPATDDELPVLGEGNIKNLIYATGHHRNGILLAPITAEIISKYIYARKESKYFKVFSPLRFE